MTKWRSEGSLVPVPHTFCLVTQSTPGGASSCSRCHDVRLAHWPLTIFLSRKRNMHPLAV